MGSLFIKVVPQILRGRKESLQLRTLSHYICCGKVILYNFLGDIAKAFDIVAFESWICLFIRRYITTIKGRKRVLAIYGNYMLWPK